MSTENWNERAELFLGAQSSARAGHAAALAELRGGQKTGHWIWYVFPQVAGLGRSAVAERFGIVGTAEARDYLAHPVLGERLLEAIDAVLGQLSAPLSIPLDRLMGGRLDGCKLVSSCTLFEAAARSMASHDDPTVASRAEAVADRCRAVLQAGAQQGFDACRFTLAAVGP